MGQLEPWLPPPPEAQASSFRVGVGNAAEKRLGQQSGGWRVCFILFPPGATLTSTPNIYR